MKEAELQTPILQKISHKTEAWPRSGKGKAAGDTAFFLSPRLSWTGFLFEKMHKSSWEMTSTQTDSGCVFQTENHQGSRGAACWAGSWLPSSFFWIQPSRTCLWCYVQFCKCVRCYLFCLFWKTQSKGFTPEGRRIPQLVACIPCLLWPFF